MNKTLLLLAFTFFTSSASAQTAPTDFDIFQQGQRDGTIALDVSYPKWLKKNRSPLQNGTQPQSSRLMSKIGQGIGITGRAIGRGARGYSQGAGQANYNMQQFQYQQNMQQQTQALQNMQFQNAIDANRIHSYTYTPNYGGLGGGTITGY
jgi:hypothetical protein